MPFSFSILIGVEAEEPIEIESEAKFRELAPVLTYRGAAL